MDKKTKIFFSLFCLVIVASVVVTYYRIMVKKDYVIKAETDCDPETERCFIWHCDPQSKEEGEGCTGDPEEDTWYYKIATRKAKNINTCDPASEGCEPFLCQSAEDDCGELLCDDKTSSETGDECNDPAEYLLNNQPEEEAEEEMEEDSEEAGGCDTEEGECEEVLSGDSELGVDEMEEDAEEPVEGE